VFHSLLNIVDYKFQANLLSSGNNAAVEVQIQIDIDNGNDRSSSKM
jgi:hypothetical protein